MKRTFGILIATAFLLSSFMFVQAKTEYKIQKQKDKNGIEYESVTNDPTQLRVYTLQNGLKLYLSVNKDEPRIQTYIAVKAGSTYDPSETTGLAHYLEHLMFKGSSHYGTIDWEKEKVLIKEISDLYEKHRSTNNADEKKVIYAQIDSVSQIAAQYAVANEYDKMVASIGAKGTNAYTSEERTVYVNNIPSNELEKWLMLERERFGDLVLRLFHTELETVYEEFNMYQDMDAAKLEEAFSKAMFLKHPYGTQTTIGRPEHLKNPSMVNILNYWKTYYVPNNMAICLSGDIDIEATAKLIDKYWGNMKTGTVPKFVPPVEDPIKTPRTAEVFGPESESIQLGFRFNGVNSDDELYVTMIDMILSNSKAGLIDLDLNQKQKVLEAGSGVDWRKDYSSHIFSGKPREGQTLDEVKDLILGEIEKIKKGEFDEWLIQAVVNDMRLSRIRSLESNGRSSAFVQCFTQNVSWKDHLAILDKMEALTKAQLIDFTKKHYGNNYVVVYKRTGKDEHVTKVDKPHITPVDMNRNNQSEFCKKFFEIPSDRLQPVFVDYDKAIKREQIKKDIEYDYIKNVTNELFSLNYVVDMGKNNNLKLPLAVDYLQYIGSDKYSPEEIQKEFFKYGLSFSVSSGDDRCYVSVSGLSKSFEKGVELLEHYLANAKPNQDVYNEFIKGILKERTDNKLNKGRIHQGAMLNYGLYGPNSPFTNIIKENDLKAISPKELTDIVKEITSYKHRIFYYGPMAEAEVKQVVEKHHKTPSKLKDYPPAKKFAELPTDKDQVFFVNFDMVQTNILFLSLGETFNKELLPNIRLFSEYFGGGMSSIVFQEIREAKGLAYSAFCALTVPSKPEKHHYTIAYVGTQPDKMKTATDAMLELLNNMPRAEKLFTNAQDAIMKTIESSRTIKSGIFWSWLSASDRGLNYDVNHDVYEAVKTSNLDKFETFFNKYIKDKKHTYLVIGKRESIDFKVLSQLGEVKELTLEEIFNY